MQSVPAGKAFALGWFFVDRSATAAAALEGRGLLLPPGGASLGVDLLCSGKIALCSGVQGVEEGWHGSSVKAAHGQGLRCRARVQQPWLCAGFGGHDCDGFKPAVDGQQLGHALTTPADFRRGHARVKEKAAHGGGW